MYVAANLFFIPVRVLYDFLSEHEKISEMPYFWNVSVSLQQSYVILRRSTNWVTCTVYPYYSSSQHLLKLQWCGIYLRRFIWCCSSHTCYRLFGKELQCFAVWHNMEVSTVFQFLWLVLCRPVLESNDWIWVFSLFLTYSIYHLLMNSSS